MPRILLSAYACEPGRGSEPGLGWHWATELARLGHDVWVLTRAGNRSTIERSPASQAAGLHFLYYDLPAWVLRWRKGGAGKLLYYLLWQWLAARRIRKLFPILPFDFVQHVTYASIRYPSFMGSLGLPFYLGPVAGGETVPRQLRSALSIPERCRELLRDASNRFLRFDPMIRSALHKANKVLVTRDTLPLLPHRWRSKGLATLSIGLSREYLQQAATVPLPSDACFRLLYVGRLIPCKGVDIALHALHQLKQTHPSIRFTVIGDGSDRAALERLAAELKLSHLVHWTGWLSANVVEQHYRAADLFLFPALRDSGGMAALEAMAHSLPVVCAGLGGPAGIVNRHCGRVVPVEKRTRPQLAAAFAEALREIIRDPELHQSLSHHARIRAEELEFQNLVRSVYPQPFVATLNQAS